MENVRKEGGLISYQADFAITAVCTNNHPVAHVGTPDYSEHPSVTPWFVYVTCSEPQLISLLKDKVTMLVLRVIVYPH